jgi:hypothetical protein
MSRRWTSISRVYTRTAAYWRAARRYVDPARMQDATLDIDLPHAAAVDVHGSTLIDTCMDPPAAATAVRTVP